MPQRKKNIFGFGKQKVTYHRDVAKERRDLRKHALEERQYKAAQRKQEASERADQEREDAVQLRREKLERKKADAVDRKIEREMREAGLRNPHDGPRPGGMNATEKRHDAEVRKLIAKRFAEGEDATKVAARVWRSYGYLTDVKDGILIVQLNAGRERFTPRQRNPERSAAALSEAWHGRPAKSATDHIDKIHYHGVLTDLGRLKEITVMVTERKGQKIFFDAETRLASSENGKQLYVVDGDQSLDLSALGIEGEEAEKDMVVIGEVYSIVYVTAKQHLGKADKEVGPYEHQLGEKGGTMPILIYDTLNKEIGFAGGSYFIDAHDYDGAHSAGIRN